MSEEEKSFSVKDHRRFNPDGSPREEAGEPDGQPAGETRTETEAGHGEESPAPKEAQTETQFAKAKAEDRAAEAGGAGSRPPLPPVEFSGLVLSLSHAAMMHLGQIPDPNTGQAEMDREMARHAIDTLGMLKEKTAGNLTPEEQRLIDSALTELRLAYVRLNR